MILNQSQAEAIYSAMCAMNNVGGRIAVNFDEDKAESINIFEKADGTVSVWQRNYGLTHNDETHTSQAAFATAYGLDHA